MNALHPYYMTSLVLIITSLVLQVVVGLGLLYSNGYNLKRGSDMKSANKFSNLSIIGVFFITIINVLISTFNGTNFSSVSNPQVPNTTALPTLIPTTGLMTTTEMSVVPHTDVLESVPAVDMFQYDAV
jgi:hypothetical protein